MKSIKVEVFSRTLNLKDNLFIQDKINSSIL